MQASEADLEADEDGNGSGSVFLVTFIIVLIWIAILCLVVKLDLGGFGSNVLTPVLKDVPVCESDPSKEQRYGSCRADECDSGSYGGYEQSAGGRGLYQGAGTGAGTGKIHQIPTNTDEVSELKGRELNRLKTFEDSQAGIRED